VNPAGDTMSNETSAATEPVVTLARRLQQHNQQEILSKLLHDLRNPIHAVRITIELFSRIARREGDLDALMERAALYVSPGEAAVEQLVRNCERLGRWLSTPSAVTLAAMPLQDWLEELRLLLRACRPRMQIDWVLEAEPDVQVLADRARLGHAMFRYCLDSAASRILFRVRPGSERSVHVEVSLEGVATGGPERAPKPFDATELQALIAQGGGAPAHAPSHERPRSEGTSLDPCGLTLTFSRPASATEAAGA